MTRPRTHSVFHDSVFEGRTVPDEDRSSTDTLASEEGAIRQLRVLFSPHTPMTCCKYAITTGGIVGV